MIRATTGGVMRTYRYNLMNSFINMNKSMNTILSQRTFNSFAEDPAAAAKAFRLRKSRMTLESQYSICTDAHKKYETAVACLQSIDDVLCTKEGEYGYYMKTLTGTTLTDLNDPTGDAREQLAKVLDQMSQGIIQTMNQKYGDNFIFAGADGHNVPFEIRDNKLYYRGVPVDVGYPKLMTDQNDDSLIVNKNGQVIRTVGTGGEPGDDEFYLKPGNLTAITKEEYEALYENVVPKVEEGADGLPVEYGYDEDNNLVEKVGGGYLKRIVTDENGDPVKDDSGETVTELITVDEYYDALNRQNNPPPRLQNANGTLYTEDLTDEDGTTTTIYYIVDGDPQVISPADYKQNELDIAKLEYLAHETEFVDIGYGFQEDPVTGKLIESSAFNIALNGINFIGYGLDEDGDPKNLYSLVQRMREVSQSVKSGTDWSEETYNEFFRLVQKFEDGVSNYQTEFANLDASTTKLISQTKLLEENRDNVWEQYSNIEDVDAAEAITAFLWAQYSYNSALRVGNSVLSQSLMDYLS